MSRISETLWARLGNERIQGESLWARLAAPDVTERLLGALDADERRHFLVPLQNGELEVQDSQSRGLVVATRQLSGRGHEPGRYLDITCLDAAGHDAFDLIGGELAGRLASGRETAAECVTRVLSRWRRFWGQGAKNILSREAQLGLFAELWFLSWWLVPRLGISATVNSWRGPFGSRHDFEWIGRSVEVKATASTRGPIHRINGLDQLEDPEQGDLLLFSLILREESGATNTLLSLITRCRTLLFEDAEALNRLDAALSRLGYLSIHEEDYDRSRFRVVEERLFEVRDDFPRLTKEDFNDGLPPGVARLEYEIDLSGFDRLCIARRPSDTFSL